MYIEMGADKAFARLLLMAGLLMSIISCSQAYDFYAGGKDGWVLNPRESYSQWSGRNRFQVHDKLVFKYKVGEDSVLLVSKEDYDKCNVSNPIKKFDDGNTAFEFDRTGPFYFISGAPGKCSQGQKLSLVVLALKTKKATTSPAPSPTSSSPSTSTSPSSASPPASSSSPSASPTPSSQASSPSASPTPSSQASSPSASPESSPTSSPSMSPSATMESPVSSPSSGVPSSLSPGQSNEPTNVGSSPGTSPTSPQSAGPALAATWKSFGLVALLFGGLFLG